MEPVQEPCILATWCMKREFSQKLTGKQNIYENAAHTGIEAFVRAGTNLCSQFIMPGTVKDVTKKQNKYET